MSRATTLRPWLHLFGVTLLVGAALPARADPAEIPDPLQIRKLASPRVCLVRADGPLGLPEAYASGFLLGSGKFVITDLASVARPGVGQVTLQFEDGTRVTAHRFGMADPATGLVAIELPKPRTEPGGLTLSTAAVASDQGLPTIVLGWRYAEEIGLVTGRLVNGLPADELANRCNITGPAGRVTFLSLHAPATSIATGAPVLDATGGVVGIMMRLNGVGPLLAVPAGALRLAFLEAKPELKPFSQLPKPLWPVAVEVLAGKPMTPQQFAGAARAIKARSRCDKCGGAGTVTVKKVVGHRRIGGMVRPIIQRVPQRCDACGGDGIVCPEGIYAYFQRMAEAATRLAADPATPDSVMQAAVTNTNSLLAALRQVNAAYRNRLARQASKDLGKGGGTYPRGLFLYAQRLETVRHAGRQYTFLSPFQSSVRFVVPTEDLGHPLGVDKGKGAHGPGPGDWVILAGLARGRVRLDKHHAIYVKPFGWGWGPNLGPPPAYLAQSSEPSGSHRPPPPPPSKRDDGKPDFFGL